MHIQLYLRGRIPRKMAERTPKAPDFRGYSVWEEDSASQYVRLNTPVPQLPEDLLRAEDDGWISHTVIKTSGDRNAPVEGVYDYSEVEGKGFYATVEIYHDGTWNLAISASQYAHAYQALSDIRSCAIAPTTFWGVQPAESGETRSTSNRELGYILLVAIGCALVVAAYIPSNKVTAATGLLVLVIAFIWWQLVINRGLTVQSVAEPAPIKFPQAKAYLAAVATLREHASYLSFRRNKSDKN